MKFKIYFHMLTIIFVCVNFQQPVLRAESSHLQSIFVLTAGTALNPGEGLESYTTQLYSYPDGLYAYSNSRSFNDLNPDRMFSHTFKSLNINKKHIFDARMSVCLKPLNHLTAISYNDTVELRFVNQSGTSVGKKWIRQIGTTRDEEDEVIKQGIFPELWQYDASNGITFKKEFDLSALPSTDGNSISLIDDLNQMGYLDLIIQDETVVESVRLTLTYCNDNMINGFMNHDAIYPGEIISIDLIAQGTDVYTLSTTLLAKSNILSYSHASYGNFFPKDKQHVTPIHVQPDGRIVASMSYKGAPEFIPRENFGTFVRLTYQSLLSYCGPVSINFENIQFIGSTDQSLIYEYEPIEFEILDDSIHCGNAAIRGQIELPVSMPDEAVIVQITRNGKTLEQMTDDNLFFEFTDLRETSYEIQALTNDYSSDSIRVYASESSPDIPNLSLRKNNFCLSISGSGPITINEISYALPYSGCFARDSQIQLVPHHSFFQWTGDLESEQAAYTIVLDQDKMLTAHYANSKINGLLKIPDGTPDGIITIVLSGDSEVYTSIVDENNQFIITEIRQGEYDIQAIAGQFSSDPQRIVLQDNDHQPVTLDLRKNEYSLKLNGVGKILINDSIHDLPYSETFDRDSEISLKAMEHFIRWSGDILNNASLIELTMDTDKTISVHYANGCIFGKIILPDGVPSDDIIIQMTSSENEYLTRANSSRNYTFNHILPGIYEIQALSSDFSSYTQMLSVSEQGSQTIHLDLRKNKYQLLINGSASITVNDQFCSIPYVNEFPRDSMVLLTADSNFIQWTGDIENQKTNPYSLEMNHDRQISVIYAEGLVTGKIEFPDGLPQGGITINLSCDSNSFQTTADENHAFTFSNLRQDKYRIQAVTETFSSGLNTIHLLNNDDHKSIQLVLRKKNYLLSIDGAGLIFINDIQYSLPYSDYYHRDSNLTLKTTSNFISWSGSITGELSPYVLLMDSDKSIMVNYARGAVSGLISYPDGIPSNAVTISLSNNDNQYSIDTNQKYYSFENIKKGTYDIHAFALGYSSDHNSIVIENDQPIDHDLTVRKDNYSLFINGSGKIIVNGNSFSLPYFTTFPRYSTINLEAGDHFVRWTGDLDSEIASQSLIMDRDKNIQIIYAKGQIKGIVDYTDGLPGNPVNVFLKSKDDNVQEQQVQNNSFLFQGLQEGDYQLWAASNNYSSDIVDITLLKDEERTIQVYVRKNQYQLYISGSGTVTVNQIEYDLPFDDLFERDRLVTIQGPENFLEWQGDEISQSNPHLFTLNTDKQIVAYYATGKFDGSISLKDGQPESTITVQLKNGHLIIQKKVNSDLTFSFSGIRQGTYQLFAFTDLFSSEIQEFTISDNQTIPVNLLLRKKAYQIHLDGCGPVVINDQSYALPYTQSFSRDSLLLLSPPSDFLNWAGDISGTETPLNILMDSDKDILVKCLSINWKATIQATAEDEFTSDFTIGVGPSEELLDSMPMPPNDFSVQMAIELPGYDPELYIQYIQKESYSIEPYIFPFWINPAGNSVSFNEEMTSVMSWHPENFFQNDNWFYLLREGKNGNIIIPNMKLTNQLSVTGTSQNYPYTIEFSPYVYYSLKKGWNLISLCVTPETSSLTALFSDAIAAFEYDEKYINVNSLQPSLGYWLKLQNGGTYQLRGTSFDTYSINLKKGWNLIGSINIDTVLPVTDPPGMIESIFAFDDFYFRCKALSFGQGYWIKALAPCILYVDPKK